MPTIDPRVDEFIAKAQPFAQPILRRLRATVHEACPAAVETMKWGMPHFDYNGRMMAMMAAFKQHAVFGFWHGSTLLRRSTRNAEAMGDFGRITSVRDLPPKRVTIALIRQAMALNESGARPIARKPYKAKKAPPRTPRDLTAALKQKPKAAAHFKAFSPSHRREYIEWITEAKTAATRAKRVAQTVAWVAQGKHRNWRYER